MSSETVSFYDGLAADYHLVYGDRWDEAVVSQGAALARVIRSERPGAMTVLDCTCGIGTQAIGLARAGFAVTGTDISEVSVARARVEAQRRGAQVEFGVADVRDLSGVHGPFDVVLSADNALPHLLDDADLSRALRAMRSRLRRGGLLVVTIRDYDRALVERPATSLPLVIAGPPRRVVVRLHDWEAPDSPFYTVRFLICTEDDGGWRLEHHSAPYRAITRGALTSLVEAAGFSDVSWRTEHEAGLHQPVMTATAT
jgi:glycine/sarcosine N-methyltransferase